MLARDAEPVRGRPRVIHQRSEVLNDGVGADASSLEFPNPAFDGAGRENRFEVGFEVRTRITAGLFKFGDVRGVLCSCSQEEPAVTRLVCAVQRPASDSSRLTRASLYGVLIISGAGLLGALLQQTGIGAIGTLLRVLSWLAFSALTLVGAGAWLRAEFKAGTLARLWSGRRKATVAAPATAAAAPESGSAGGITTPPGEPPVTTAGA